MKRSTLPILVFIAAVTTIIFNILTNALPLNGQNTGEISDLFKVYFVPAGYVFSIWGIIYIGMVAYAIYQAQKSRWEDPRLQSIAWLFMGSCIANIAWLFFWHYNLFGLTLVAMVALLVQLILIYLKLHPGRKEASPLEKWSVHYPFSVYLGWISVATIANVTDVLYYFHWDGFGVDPVTWALIMLLIGTLLAVAFYILRKDLVVPLVFIWAYIGIAMKFKEIPQLNGAAWVYALLIAFTMFVLDLAKKIKAGSEIPPPGVSG